MSKFIKSIKPIIVTVMVLLVSACSATSDLSGGISGKGLVDQNGKPTIELNANLKQKMSSKTANQKLVTPTSNEATTLPKRKQNSEIDFTSQFTGKASVDQKGKTKFDIGVEFKAGVIGKDKIFSKFSKQPAGDWTGKIFGNGKIDQTGKPNYEFGVEFKLQFPGKKHEEIEGAPAPSSQKLSNANSEAKPLLDLIGHTEGTDRGDGYNETLAYGAYTDGDVVLTNMTLAQIDELQTAMLQHPKNKWNSSAIGRYQIVRTTLRKLKLKMGLADTTKFTPELQDALALELLKSRGYAKWKAGKMSDKKFALGLSKEWASLPNPYTGKGYYSGQNAVELNAVNRVLASLRKVTHYQ